MKYSGNSVHLIGAFVVATVVLSSSPCIAASQTPGGQGGADAIVVAQTDPQLRMLLGEVLQRNPKIARLKAQALAVEQRTPQVKALPDPTATLTWFAMPPQTRVGPQRAAVNIAQRLPWFGTLKFDEQASLWDAAGSRAVVEAERIKILSETRVDYVELQFLDSEARLIAEDRATLDHYSQLALARYASGVGIDQAVIKIQAEITRTDARLLEIKARRATLVARLNAWRDRPQSTPVTVSEVDPPRFSLIDGDELRHRALASRPEMVATHAAVEAAALRVERSKKAYSPSLVVGLNYGYVSRRSDEAGRLNPPENNGQDILGLSGGITVPLWKSSLEAGVEEGVQTQLAAEEGRREITASIDGELGDLLHRIPLLEEQIRLYDGVLLVQAKESLSSAESAYAAGIVGSLDLLDAERVLLQIRIAAARVKADLAVAHARLEGAVAGPLEIDHES